MRKQTRLFRVIPLDPVKQEAKKILNSRQLKAAIGVVKLLRFYPEYVGLDFAPCGEGFELRIGHPQIGKQGWLRAGFWVDEKSKSVYIVDIFWKKENRISKADVHRINHRIRKLKQALSRLG